MKISALDMVAAAEKKIETITITTAKQLLDTDEAVFVDLRDIRELQKNGKIPGATHAPRGMLEFWVDPSSEYHRDIFSEQKKFVFYCASAWRSALATLTVQNMGMENVCHLEGGYDRWLSAEMPTEMLKKR